MLLIQLSFLIAWRIGGATTRSYLDGFMNDLKLMVSKAGWKRIMAGHPWVFQDELVEPPKEEGGGILPLFDGLGRFLGKGFYNPDSRIAFRFVTRRDVPMDEGFWRGRLNEAVRRREELGLASDARRLVYSEADGFPGLILDDYAGCLSLQILTRGMEGIRDLLIDLLQESLSPKVVVLRCDSPVRRLEGLALEKGVVAGALPGHVEVREGDLNFRVDLLEGQKTGAYLDQRDNRLHLRSFAGGRRVLDAFCYDGWFALHLARAGAKEVEAWDTSDSALERGRVNASLNQIDGVDFRKMNCFDGLKDAVREGKAFGLIVLDPPPFARRRGDIRSALRAYKDINQRAIQCLEPGGLLFTCCCSHGISQDRFAGAVAAAAGAARRRLVLLEQRLQPLDHPILFNEPESLYLKGLLFRCL